MKSLALEAKTSLVIYMPPHPQHKIKKCEPCSGWMLIDKPEGISSAQALNPLKKLYKPNKVGHAGTLDPFASGLLMIAIGEATKTIYLAMDQVKSYSFTIHWGENRDTEDRDGIVTKTSPLIPSLEELNAVLPSFIGTQPQVPPNFSAKYVDGERAYALARRGEKFTLQANQVCLSKLHITNHHNNQTDFTVECSKGFYIRSLSRDIAAKLDVCGYVSNLRRTKIGNFNIEAAIPLAKIEKVLYSGNRENLRTWLQPLTAVLDDILVMQCDQAQALDLCYGRAITRASSWPENGLLCLSLADKPISLCKVIGDKVHPTRVFNIQ